MSAIIPCGFRERNSKFIPKFIELGIGMCRIARKKMGLKESELPVICDEFAVFGDEWWTLAHELLLNV